MMRNGRMFISLCSDGEILREHARLLTDDYGSTGVSIPGTSTCTVFVFPKCRICHTVYGLTEYSNVRYCTTAICLCNHNVVLGVVSTVVSSVLSIER